MIPDDDPECGAVFEAHIDGVLYSDTLCDLDPGHDGPHSNLVAALHEAMDHIVIHDGPCPSCSERG